MKRILLLGPPGCGKTMIARRMAAALPRPNAEAAVTLGWLYTGARLGVESMPTGAPFRAPHHTVSEKGLCGSVSERRPHNAEVYKVIVPGEVSLAHRGCLFLDELNELRASAAERLGEILRAGSARFWIDGRIESIPARPALLVAAANSCGCGWYGFAGRECACSPERVRSHQARLNAHCARLGIAERVRLDPLTVESLMREHAR